jgi:DNA-binding transcriptional LysR family regulator
MNLNDVKLFIQVIEHNSFTAAAEKLGIQKSTISRRIAQLEDELSVRLLQRTTRKLNLTSEGQELFSRCKPLLDELASVEDQVVSKQEEPQGHLHITMPPELGIFIMNDIVASFMQKYPLLQIDLELSPRLVDLVEEGIDLALRVGELTDSSLIGRKIADAEVQLYASKTYLHKHGTPKTPDDLKHHQCIGSTLTRKTWTFENWNDGKPVSIDFKLRANSLSFCREMLRKDLGIVIMPRTLCKDEIASGEIEEVLSNFKIPTVGIHALYPSRRHLNPKVRLFIDHLLTNLDSPVC